MFFSQAIRITWPTFKLQIEAKAGNKRSAPKNTSDQLEHGSKQMKDASKQLKRGLNFFKDNIPFCKEENWTYIKIMCFGELVENVCSKCKPFVLSVKFDPLKRNEDSCDLLKEQFKHMWSLSLKAVEQQASKMIHIHNPNSFKI